MCYVICLVILRMSHTCSLSLAHSIKPICYEILEELDLGEDIDDKEKDEAVVEFLQYLLNLEYYKQKSVNLKEDLEQV